MVRHDQSFHPTHTTHDTQHAATGYLGQPGFFDVVVGVAADDGEAEEEDVRLRVGQRSYPLIRLLACTCVKVSSYMLTPITTSGRCHDDRTVTAVPAVSQRENLTSLPSTVTCVS
jgi:hypothetical protein